MKKYAFLVENEIFDTIRVPEDPEFEAMILRWNAGFGDSHIGIDISGFPDAAVGSVWVQTGFDNSNVTNHDREHVANKKRFAFLDSNNILFAQLMPPKAKEDMYLAAFETGASGMDITAMASEVTKGWVWDGQAFNPPEEK
jgi:hypothetical protein